MRIFCPYCRQTRRRSHVLYRCHVENGCEPVRAGRLRPPRRCPQGHACDERICPCGERLPTGYCNGASSIIAIVGAPGSGKSTYLTVLVHTLQEVMAEQLGGHFTAADDDTARRFREMEHRLYRAGRKLPPTPIENRDSPHRPFIFKLDLPDGASRRVTFMLFYDTAGDNVVNEDHARQVAPYLLAASGMIFLIDPEHLDAGADIAYVSQPADSPDMPTPVEVVEYITRPHENVPRRLPSRRRPLTVPIAVTLSKVDALADRLAEQSALHLAGTRDGMLREPDRQAVNEQVRALLHRWSPRLEPALDAHFRAYAFFGVSPLGAATVGSAVAPAGVRPHRVAEPFLWLLAQIGALPRSGI